MDGFISNAWLLGMVAFVLILILRKAGWATTSKQAMWLTFGVSVLLALVQITLQGEWGTIPVPPNGDPFAWAAWVSAIGGIIAAGFGKVLAVSQVIYQALKQLLGERI